jgi:hypothetical protein
MALSKIITEEALPQINNALDALNTFDNEIALAERAGLMTGPNAAALTDLKAKADKARTTLLAVKQVYFPNQ